MIALELATGEILDSLGRMIELPREIMNFGIPELDSEYRARLKAEMLEGLGLEIVDNLEIYIQVVDGRVAKTVVFPDGTPDAWKGAAERWIQAVIDGAPDKFERMALEGPAPSPVDFTWKGTRTGTRKRAWNEEIKLSQVREAVDLESMCNALDQAYQIEPSKISKAQRENANESLRFCDCPECSDIRERVLGALRAFAEGSLESYTARPPGLYERRAAFNCHTEKELGEVLFPYLIKYVSPLGERVSDMISGRTSSSGASAQSIARSAPGQHKFEFQVPFSPFPFPGPTPKEALRESEHRSAVKVAELGEGLVRAEELAERYRKMTVEKSLRIRKLERELEIVEVIKSSKIRRIDALENRTVDLLERVEAMKSSNLGLVATNERLEEEIRELKATLSDVSDRVYAAKRKVRLLLSQCDGKDDRIMVVTGHRDRLQNEKDQTRARLEHSLENDPLTAIQILDWI